MKKREILRLVVEWQNRILRIEGIERDYESALRSMIGAKPIKIITGFRRSGKSFLVQRVAKKLVADGLFPISNILYLNFEDFRLAEVNTPEKAYEIYTSFRTEIADPSKKILILDEIQNVTNWDRLVRTLYETDQDIEILLTGSNSELLSSEIGSRLAGRFIEISILPFDFREYLRYKGAEPEDLMAFHRNHEPIRNHFHAYMKFGGIPEILTIQDENARFSYIEGIVSKVILDDIIRRFHIKHSTALERIFFYLLSATGNLVSFRRISNYLKLMDIHMKQETVILYVQYILKAFAMYEINKFDWKLGKVFATTRKYYSVDTGLINLYPPAVSNFSHQLENVVFLQLRRKQKLISFGALSSGKEIDFIARGANGQTEKIQVTQTLNEDNYERELSPFQLQGTSLETGNNLLLTLDGDDQEIQFKDSKVSQENLIGWLLDLDP